MPDQTNVSNGTKLNTNLFTRDGATFVGWVKDPSSFDPNLPAINYEDEDEFNITTTDNAAHLYAVWRTTTFSYDDAGYIIGAEYNYICTSDTTGSNPAAGRMSVIPAEIGFNDTPSFSAHLIGNYFGVEEYGTNRDSGTVITDYYDLTDVDEIEFRMLASASAYRSSWDNSFQGSATATMYLKDGSTDEIIEHWTVSTDNLQGDRDETFTVDITSLNTDLSDVYFEFEGDCSVTCADQGLAYGCTAFALMSPDVIRITNGELYNSTHSH